MIAPDNPVRIIDAFVDRVDLGKIGVLTAALNSEGRPSLQSFFAAKALSLRLSKSA